MAKRRKIRIQDVKFPRLKDGEKIVISVPAQQVKEKERPMPPVRR